MASSGSDVPAARAVVAVNHLAEARDGAARLRAFLLQLQLDDQRAAWAQLEIDGVLTRLSSAMSALDVSVAAGSDGATARPHPQQSAGSSCANKRKQGSSRSRSQRPSDKKITATLEDGHVWRKYGQKDIQDSPYPRSYFRCTHKADQGCGARRQVQRCETDTSKYVVAYYGEHTCRDPSTFPLIIDHAAELEDRANNLISFGPSGTGTNANDDAAAAARNAAASSSQHHQYLQQATMMGGSSAAADQLSTSWCTSDDVFSSSAGSLMQVDELIGVVVGSVTSVASDHRRGVLGVGGVAGGGTASSFPPSPNSLGFVVGSLGTIGSGEDDDDMFRLDP